MPLLMDWDELNQRDKAEFIKIGITNGYRDLDSIKDLYTKSINEDKNYLSNKGYIYERNKFAFGGNITFQPNIYKPTNDNYYKYMEDKAINDNPLYDALSRQVDLALLNNLNDNTYDYKSDFNNQTFPYDYSYKDTYDTQYSPLLSDNSIYYNDNGNINYGSLLSLNNDRDYNAAYDLAKKRNSKVYPIKNNNAYLKIYKAARNEGANHNQAIALVANAYAESNGSNINQTNGPASGYFQMEPALKKSYENWKSKNRISNKDEVTNQTRFMYNLFKNKDTYLQTPYTNYMRESNNGKKQLGNNYRSLKRQMANNEYHNYDNNKAYNDWYSNNVENTTRSFMALAERPSIPRTKVRLDAAKYFNDKFKKYDNK